MSSPGYRQRPAEFKPAKEKPRFSGRGSFSGGGGF